MNNLGSGSGSGSGRLPGYLLNDGGLRGYPGEMYGRRADAICLNFCRKASGCTSEKKICISPHGGMDVWQDNLYGFTRVVVHGEDSLCAVARIEDVERVKRQGKEVGQYIDNMHNALIYEAEDLTLPCGGVGKMTCRRIEKPFVAVSLAPSTNSGNEASGAEYNVDSAITFLKEEMDSGATSTFMGTLKTAIFTLDHLFGKTFKANEIEIFTVKKYRGRVMGLSRQGLPVTEYPIRGKRSIKDHLDVINKTCNGASSSRSRVVVYKPCSGGSPREKWRRNVINKACKRRLNVITRHAKVGSSRRRQ